MRAMPRSLDTLAGLHNMIERCRRMAVEPRDREAARIASELADDLEKYVRQATFGAQDSKVPPKLHQVCRLTLSAAEGGLQMMRALC